MKIAGINVSSKTVTLVIGQAGQTGKPREFRNTPEGHVGLSKILGKAQVSRVGLEATGLYHLDPAVALDDAGLDCLGDQPQGRQTLR